MFNDVLRTIEEGDLVFGELLFPVPGGQEWNGLRPLDVDLLCGVLSWHIATVAGVVEEEIAEET